MLGAAAAQQRASATHLRPSARARCGPPRRPPRCSAPRGINPPGISTMAQRQQQPLQQQQQQEPGQQEPAAAPPLPQQPFCLARNGRPCACAQPSGAWLQAAPRGAYTTARTVGGGARVLKLSSHVERLATSANLMVQSDEQLVTSAGHEPAPPFTAQQLRPRVMDCLAAVIAAFQSGACSGGAAPAAGAADAAATDAAAAAAGGNGAARRAAAESAAGRELKLTLLMTWQDPASGEFDLWCHGEALPRRPAPPVKLQIRGLPRTNARAKDSEWVRQRRALEEARPADCNEVVLCSPEGALMEGLSSNFFVLQRGELVTADEGVLSGTIREIVLAVCRDLGLPVRLEPPQLSQIAEWDGALISSTSRLLLPADEVRWAPPGHGGPGGTERVRAFDRGHPIVAELEAAVMARILLESEPVPLPPPQAAPRAG
ncbi:hypothetical protein Rsub_06318 [Raphidocelis subcapitata]|uniref:Uncharacterized protein n=1 Tax=Raphidocelis subcapitata TaxID=307507 RepID=A0A2V0P148_9CHLO|nr:hypothetical protein Rsub_06318 [Raphidocelis subcapitata]|eukprot:GBF93598.1 hypothetical protein Rsub_06318 [Raphidocelis subcapitata]